MATSSEVIDAVDDPNLRSRLLAVRPDHVTEGQLWDSMRRIVQADVGDGHSIAVGFRYALGQGGLRAGADPAYVTDAHLRTALAAVFPEPTS